jgi:hypothetical protein
MGTEYILSSVLIIDWHGATRRPFSAVWWQIRGPSGTGVALPVPQHGFV